jgi:hypothetical protein
LQFLVKWLGCGTEENQWVYEEDCTSDGKIENEAINTYWRDLAAETGTHFAPAPMQTPGPKKALKFKPKAKIAKPESAKRKSVSAPATEPKRKLRKYRKVAGSS